MSYIYKKDTYPLLKINGIIMSNSTTDTVNDIAFSSGYCVDDAYSNIITPESIVKQIDSTFSPGSSAGMLINSTAKSNSATYYNYAIGKTSDQSAFDYVASTALLTSSTQLPAGWDIKSLIGVFQTNSTGSIIQGKWWRVGNSINFRYGTPKTDLVGTASTGDVRTLLTSTAPANSYADFLFRAYSASPAGSYLTWGAIIENDSAPDATTCKMDLVSDYLIPITAIEKIPLDSNRQIFYRGVNSTYIDLVILCLGWDYVL